MNIKLPERSDFIYEHIETFYSYHFTKCIAYEMAIRNKEVVIIKNLIDKLLIDNKKEYSETKEEEIKLLNERLFNDYWIRYIYEDFMLNFPLKIGSGLKLGYLNYISRLHKEMYPDITTNMCFKKDGVIKKYFRKIRIPKKALTLIPPETIYKETIIPFNLNLPEHELIEYLKEIKSCYDKQNDNSIEIFVQKIFYNDGEDFEKSDNKKINKKLIADKFFIYDYITASQEEIIESNEFLYEEYEEEIQKIKNNPENKQRDRKIQLKELKREFEENANTRKDELFADIENFTSATAKRYYYDIKPFIDDCKYKELITGMKL